MSSDASGSDASGAAASGDPESPRRVPGTLSEPLLPPLPGNPFEVVLQSDFTEAQRARLRRQARRAPGAGGTTV